MDADLLKSRTHAIGTKLRTFHHELSYLSDRAHCHPARGFKRRAQFIVQPRMALGGPAFEHLIHPVSRRLAVGADGRDGPPLRVEIDNGSPSLVGISDLGIGRIAPRCHRWLWSISQRALDGMVGELAAKTQEANGRDFTEAKARIFRLEIDDQLAHLRWETAPRSQRFTALFGKQRSHALLLKSPGLIVERAFTCS